VLSAEDRRALRDLRAAGAATMVRTVSDAARHAVGAGSVTRVRGFGDAETLSYQGFTAKGLAAADAVGVGFGTLQGAALQDRAQAVNELLEGRPLGASLNWSPRRDVESWARDLSELGSRGIESLSFYNFGLVPSRALATMGEVARAWRKEHP
jgi:hypothetical protein